MLDLNVSTGVYNRKIDKDNSLLIIGKGQSEYKNKEILYCSTIEEVEKIYGDNSELTEAFKEAKEIGAENISLCNCYKFTDYVTMLNQVANQEFAYITPLFNFSETFITNDNMKMYLSEIYSNILNDRPVQIIVTDQHASLFEDLQHFVNSMNQINNRFKDSTLERLTYGANLCFVLNNLKSYKFANVALASILTQSNLKEYPHKDIGDVVFDLNNYDVYKQELAYFAYDDLSRTTIENFLNYNPVAAPEKFVPVNLVKQRIQRALDFSEYAGSMYKPYLEIILENKVNDIMGKFVGNLIEKYKVYDFIVNTTKDKRVIIKIPISIKPYNSIEEISLILEV